jgi:YaiO family outer membrane protein
MKSPILMAAALLVSPAAARAQVAHASIDASYTDYSKAFGSRRIASADVRGLLGTAVLSFTASNGQRRFADATFKGTKVAGSVTNNWTDRLSTRTSVSLATNQPVFARSEIAQDVSYKLLQNAVVTVGAKRAAYFGGTHVNSLSAGGTYYLRGASIGYRFSALDTEELGRSYAHQLNLRVPDSGGRGATQLWVGRGTSLQDVAWLPTPGRGNYTSVAVRRLQPIASGVALSVTADRTWFNTPAANYTGSTLRVGLDFARPGLLGSRVRRPAN